MRARYLVFFQYLGTDFKYVFPQLPHFLHSTSREIRETARRGRIGSLVVRSWDAEF